MKFGIQKKGVVILNINKNLLHARVVEQGLRLQDLAEMIGMAYSTFSQKLNGAREFSRQEMLAIKTKLCLNEDDFLNIFFPHEG